jgi:hypothetical protein
MRTFVEIMVSRIDDALQIIFGTADVSATIFIDYHSEIEAVCQYLSDRSA